MDLNTHFQNAAIKLIDEALYARGHLSLIAGQPLYPIKPQSVITRPPAQTPNLANGATQPQRMAQPPPHSQTHIQQQGQMRIYPTAQASNTGPSHQFNNANANSLFTSRPLLGSSKRPYSPKEEIVKKRPKVIDAQCQVCGGIPHLVKDCPVVLAGPKRSGAASRSFWALSLTSLHKHLSTDRTIGAGPNQA